MIPHRNLSMLSNRLAKEGGRRIPESVLERDYCLAWFLVALSRTPLRERLAFKGGTALKRCYFGEYRFSEDLDFTLTGDVPFDVIRGELDAVFAEAGRAGGLALRFSHEDTQSHQNSYTFFLSYEGPLPAAARAAAAESALLKLYTEVWLPRAEEGGIGIEKVAAGGRPLQTTLNDKKQAMIHERIVELITSVQPRVFSSLSPNKIVELFRLGEGTPPTLGIGTGDVVDGFYSFLGFTRLMTSGVIRKAVAKGVQDAHFGYVSGPKPPAGPDGKFQVALTKVRFKVPVSEDEIDLESGFLMLPQAIPEAPAVTGGETPVVVTGGGESGTGAGTVGGTTTPTGVTVPGVTVPPAKPTTDKTVDITFTTDRNGLFTAWNAIANLADMAGKVQVTIHAESEKGFEKSKLQNGVMEPLREADLID